MFEFAAKSLQLTKVPLGLKNLTLPAGLGDPIFIVIPPEVVDKFKFLKTLCPGRTFVKVDDVKSSEISTAATVVLALKFVNEILIPHSFEFDFLKEKLEIIVNKAIVIEVRIIFLKKVLI